jgi:outer membrane receptor protein involved in Fe transport
MRPTTIHRSLLAAAVCAFTLAVLSPPARADAVADEADFRFNRAAAFFKQGKLEEALSEFLSSNRLVRNRNVIFNIARCFEALKQPNEAHRFYSEILGDEMPEADRKNLLASLERLRPSLAILDVKTNPPGATVYINRRDLGARGQTPLTLALRPGKETALVELPGYKPFKAEMQLAVGKVVTIDTALERIYGAIEASGYPEEFELRVDGAEEPLLTAPGKGKALPGTRRVTVTATGYARFETQVDVPAEGVATVQFKLLPLPPPSGEINVKVDNVDSAVIRLDGREFGYSPHIGPATAGMHTVEISAPGREPITKVLLVKVGEQAKIDAHLRYLQPRVVAAERKLTRAEDSPASITVLSGEELRAFGYSTLAEALRSVRGFYTTNDREYEAAGERGFSTVSTYNQRILILNDGHVTNEISYGQGAVGRDFDADLSDVERIEIVRGPGSVLYGSAAFFGVVNVVHQTPQPGVHATAGGTLGSLGEQIGRLAMSAGDAERWVMLRGAVSDAKNDALFLVPDAKAPAGSAPVVAQDLDFEYAGHADLRARYKDLTISATYNYRKKSLPTGTFQSVPGAPGSNMLDRRGFVEANYNHAFDSGLGIELRASYDAYRNKANWNYLEVGAGLDTLAADWLTGEARIRLPEVFHNKLLVGAEYQDRYNVQVTSFVPGVKLFDNESSDPTVSRGAPSAETIFSVYAGDEITLHKRARFNLAARLDKWPTFGTVFNPRVVGLFQLYEDGTTKAIFGQAFRGPSFAERYYDDGTTTKADPGLQPELITTYELEHTHQLNDETTLVGTVYHSRISQLINNVLLTTGPEAGEAQLQNSEGITTSTGAEVEARWQPTSGTLISFWYAWSRLRDPQGHPVPNSPEHSGAVRLMLPLVNDVLSLSTEVVYGGPRRTVVDADAPQLALVGESLRWNLGITGQYRKYNVRYGLFAQNLLDEKVTLPSGPEIPGPNHAVPQYGRVLRLQLSANF